MVPKRYSALRIIATINKVLGILVVIVTILVAAGAFISLAVGGAALDSFSAQFGEDTNFAGLFGGVMGGLVIGIMALVNGLILALALYAFGEGIYVLLDMETNTRTTAMLLQRRAAAAAAIPAPAPVTMVPVEQLPEPPAAVEAVPAVSVVESETRPPAGDGGGGAQEDISI